MTVVAITGAGGMIGRHLVDALRDSGCVIRALLLPNEAVPPSFEDVRLYRGDVRNPSDLATFVDGADTVFHLASLVGHDANKVSIDRARQVNVDGTRNVMAAAKNHNVARFVFLSTCSVYGLHGVSGEIIDERTAHHPSKLAYDMTKAEAEAAVTSESSEALAWSVLQIPVALGGEHTLDKPSLLSISRLLKFGIVPKPMSGTTWANYVFGRDAADALIALANHPEAIGHSFIYSESVSQPVFLSWISSELGRRPIMIPIPQFAFNLVARATQFGPALINTRRFSAAKIEDMLNFRPSVGLKAGLAQTIHHYRKIGLIR